MGSENKHRTHRTLKSVHFALFHSYLFTVYVHMRSRASDSAFQRLFVKQKTAVKIIIIPSIMLPLPTSVSQQ
jgi:hypothetical protein